jgi:hypothetical protein
MSEEEDTQFWSSASEKSLMEVWENTEDDVYAETCGTVRNSS